MERSFFCLRKNTMMLQTKAYFSKVPKNNALGPKSFIKPRMFASKDSIFFNLES